ncbi:hypothetical protein BIV57_21660 [Mangrovactinospora gilvigrisea]|uniref:Amidohydrolase-related domain-containing protein n=1 Tax=Mangrovactinospora gilvigrisea TaxID=1428644 RepID=A0A1J7BPM7_9ACTN|nr:amidohydrolase family protein [Mangrovactinospora gilvigrisea]OIV35401.1 hypothetical protein BIV57_21660 [Mangrovactinospora gilvigrisea]
MTTAWRLDPEALPPLVDHHCHGLIPAEEPMTEEALARRLTESDTPPAPGTTHLDSQLGFAVRRWCAPLLGLEPHAAIGDYLARRTELGGAEAERRLLGATGIGAFLVDTGFRPAGPALGGPSPEGTVRREVVRLETLAEEVVAASGAHDFADRFEAAVEAAVEGGAVAFKSIMAYRHGFRLHRTGRPGRREVRRAADHALMVARLAERPVRINDPVLHRFLLWTAADSGLPIQIHTGFGDPDLRLAETDPALLTELLRELASTGCEVVLLHGYPFHRSAAYLAAVLPHVYADVGLTLHHVGARAAAVLAEYLELAPFGKLLFSTDAAGVPELYAVAALTYREALATVLAGFVADGAWAPPDAERVARLVSTENALRVYGMA